MSRLRLALLYGGRSAEHEVSLLSARSVVEALDPAKYELLLVGIDRSGHWHFQSRADFDRVASGSLPSVPEGPDDCFLAPSPGGRLVSAQGEEIARLDVVFPLVHGTYGEDGTLQGLFELADVAYVGAGVLGSALGMDKDAQKRLFREGGLPVVEFYTLRRAETTAEKLVEVGRKLSFPLFVKPANSGSSVGVAKADDEKKLAEAVEAAFSYDDKILVERALRAREIECSVLGNEFVETSVPGEVVPSHEFYSYEAKYLDPRGATFRVPAPLSPEETREVRALAAAAFRAIECEGMARVDFFLEEETGKFFVNEVNTIPGFTPISQYPRLWEASGVSYGELLDRLVELALDRHRRRRKRVFRPPVPGKDTKT
ncbi:MAG: D-alanine--D-alanine ligase [Candidatus Binatia bacterium]|nr:MAG: D-alanine--D-alanine ligase [Candidatus Binatia bacterium]